MHPIIAEYLELTPEEARELLALGPAAIMESAAARWVSEPANLAVLRASLPEAHRLMTLALPEFYGWLERALDVAEIPDSPDHAVEWVSDFIVGRRRLTDLVHYHSGLSADAIELAAPRFVALFDDLEFGRDQWRQAIALLCLALLADARR